MYKLILIFLTLNLQSQISDDTKHYHAGAIIGGGFSVIAYECRLSPFVSLSIGGLAGFAAGGLKEWYWDKHLQRGTFNRVDANYTWFGTCGGLLTAVYYIAEKSKDLKKDLL